jgi:hypothetical protein
MHASTDAASQLFIDIALIGDPHKRPTLMYIAGTHGIEGFVGSAVQHAILSGMTAPPDDYALVLVHCLNPWGMANLRRTNAHNIDLNRNCTISDHERCGAPAGYENVRRLLMPESALPFSLFCMQALAVVLRHGFPTAKQAITGGQYVDERGLFFGGLELQQELQLLRSWALQNLSRSERVLVIDIHSGLGAFTQDTLITDSHDNSKETARIRRIFPDRKLHGPDPMRSIAYETRGALSSLLPTVLVNSQVDYVVHEFGTLHAFRVLHALVQENYHHFRSPSTGFGTEHHPSKTALKEAFCPSSPSWLNNTVLRALTVYGAAKLGLARGL